MTYFGAVASGHVATTAAAAQVLRGGGNAFDAAIGAGFAAAVAEPCLTSLAGGGFLLARTANGDDPPDETILDFFVDFTGLGRTRRAAAELVRVPVRFGHAVQDFHVGPASVATPGVLAGYLHAHSRLGRLSLADVVAPAVRLCEEGVVVDANLAQLLVLLAPILARNDDGRRLFFKGAAPLRIGERFRNDDLGAFLVAVSTGQRTGFTADELGGEVTSQDIEAYAVLERRPLSVQYRDATVLTNPPPSMGGTLVAHGLSVLSTTAASSGRDDAGWARRLVDAQRAMTEHRSTLGPGSTNGTTQISVIDAEGNVASMTTSNGSCSGEFAPGTGVQLNNMMGEEDLHPVGLGAGRPGDRIGSMMSPTIIEWPDGRLAALGSGGSERIRSTVIQLAVNLIDHGDDLAKAVDSPGSTGTENGSRQSPGGRPR